MTTKARVTALRKKLQPVLDAYEAENRAEEEMLERRAATSAIVQECAEGVSDVLRRYFPKAANRESMPPCSVYMDEGVRHSIVQAGRRVLAAYADVEDDEG